MLCLPLSTFFWSDTETKFVLWKTQTKKKHVQCVEKKKQKTFFELNPGFLFEMIVSKPHHGERKKNLSVVYKTSKVNTGLFREILIQPFLPRHLVIVSMNTRSASKVKKKKKLGLSNFKLVSNFFFHLKNQKQKKLENGKWSFGSTFLGFGCIVKLTFTYKLFMN